MTSARSATDVYAATSTDRTDHEAVVVRYGHLVKYVVGRLGVSVPGVFDHDDAMQAGVVGLLAAADKYRPDAGASFESYAILRIRGAILDAVRSLDGLGRAARESARAIERAIRVLNLELGAAPNEAQIAERLGFTVERYRRALATSSVVTVSMDELNSHAEDGSAPLSDSLPDERSVDPEQETSQRLMLATMAGHLRELPERQQRIMSLYYTDELTFKEIGAVLGVTESRVCQLHAEVILTLRARLLDPETAQALRYARKRS